MKGLGTRQFPARLICLAWVLGAVSSSVGTLQRAAFGDQKQRLFCEGTYSRIGKTRSGDVKQTKLDEWRLYSAGDGTYSLEVKDAESRDGDGNLEHRVLSEKLKPISFRMEVLDRKFPGGERVKIACEFGSAQVSCRLEDLVHAVSASDTIKQGRPYGFLPIFGPFPLDLAWSYQMDLAQMDRVEGNKVLIPVVGFTEGETKDSLKLVTEDGDEIEYLGRDTIDHLDQKIAAHKFRLESSYNRKDPESLRFAWLSDSGILIQVADQGGPFLVLSSYLGPPL